MKFPRNTTQMGFGYASLAHEPAFPIKTSDNPLAPELQHRLRRAIIRSAGSSAGSMKANSAEF